MSETARTGADALAFYEDLHPSAGDFKTDVLAGL